MTLPQNWEFVANLIDPLPPSLPLPPYAIENCYDTDEEVELRECIYDVQFMRHKAGCFDDDDGFRW